MFLLSDYILLHIQSAIAGMGVLVIVAGALHALYQLAIMIRNRAIDANYIRLSFGNSVILGLEFMVGADIIGSLVEPDYYSIGLLGILVLIRTVLSFFLSRELEALTPAQREALK